MGKLVLVVLLVVAVAFLAYLAFLSARAVRSGRPIGEAIVSGFIGKRKTDRPIINRRKKLKPEVQRYYNVVSMYKGATSLPPLHKGGRTPTSKGLIGPAPGTAQYNEMANEGFEEDLYAIAAKNLFGKNPGLPRAPLTDSLFRWTGDYEIEKGDPAFASPLMRQSIGNSNTGRNIWDNHQTKDRRRA